MRTVTVEHGKVRTEPHSPSRHIFTASCQCHFFPRIAEAASEAITEQMSFRRLRFLHLGFFLLEQGTTACLPPQHEAGGSDEDDCVIVAVKPAPIRARRTSRSRSSRTSTTRARNHRRPRRGFLAADRTHARERERNDSPDHVEEPREVATNTDEVDSQHSPSSAAASLSPASEDQTVSVASASSTSTSSERVEDENDEDADCVVTYVSRHAKRYIRTALFNQQMEDYREGRERQEREERAREETVCSVETVAVNA